MKKALKLMVIGLVFVGLLAGCSKPPTEEMNAAKSSVDAIIAEGAQKYIPQESKMLNDSLNAANEENKMQESKFFKNFKKAKEMYIKVKADAEGLKPVLAAKKEEAKRNAMAALEKAKASVAEANMLLAKAPRGKGTRADIEAMKADIKGIEDSLPEVDNLLNTEDYIEAGNKATALANQADSVVQQINAAIEKVKGKRR